MRHLVATLAVLFAFLACTSAAPSPQKRTKRQTGFDYFYDFSRPPTGVYAGGLGGIYGSPIFGPPILGPFNNPRRRQERIEEIFDFNRRLNEKPTMEDKFNLGDSNVLFQDNGASDYYGDDYDEDYYGDDDRQYNNNKKYNRNRRY